MMTTLAAAMICFILFALLYAGLRIWSAWHERHLELKPNCLLTKHPIVFVRPNRFASRLFPYWKNVPTYLRAHGYDVHVWPSRMEWLKAILQAQHSPVHLVVNIDDKNLWQQLTTWDSENVRSLQMLPRPKEFFSSPRQKWKTESSYLQWAIQLAEADLTQETS